MPQDDTRTPGHRPDPDTKPRIESPAIHHGEGLTLLGWHRSDQRTGLSIQPNADDDGVLVSFSGGTSSGTVDVPLDAVGQLVDALRAAGDRATAGVAA